MQLKRAIVRFQTKEVVPEKYALSDHTCVGAAARMMAGGMPSPPGGAMAPHMATHGPPPSGIAIKPQSLLLLD